MQNIETSSAPTNVYAENEERNIDPAEERRQHEMNAEAVSEDLHYEQATVKQSTATSVLRNGSEFKWGLSSAPTEKCPKCDASMVIKTARSTGSLFYGCSRFPDCRGTRQISGTADSGGAPAPSCPLCDKTMVRRRATRGKYIGQPSGVARDFPTAEAYDSR